MAFVLKKENKNSLQLPCCSRKVFRHTWLTFLAIVCSAFLTTNNLISFSELQEIGWSWLLKTALAQQVRPSTDACEEL